MRSPLDQVIQELSSDPNLLRIKKLLIYSCRQTWETDPNQLSQYDLTSLVHELWQHSSSLEHLKIHLYRLVKTLSKPAEYTLIANALMYRLEPLYLENPETQVVQGGQPYVSVAQQLEQDADALRVKKLLYAACRQTWENDSTVLSQTPFVELIQELYRLTSTPQTLEAILNGIVCTLNRQDAYRQIAQRIAIACSPLYFTPSEPTQIISAASLPASPTPPTYPTPPTHPTSPAPITPPAPPTPPAPSLPTPIPVPAAPSPSYLFDLRLEIIKYANPLRAKVLLFSVLHGSVEHSAATWDAVMWDAAIWDRLKAEGLDDLLFQLFHRYPTLIELQTQLPQAAHLLTERDTYAHTADVILRAIKPCYPNGKAIAVQPLLPSSEVNFTRADLREVTDVTGTRDDPTSEITGIQVSSSTDPGADALP